MSPHENNARGHWVLLLVCFSAFIAASYGDCGEPKKLDFAILDNPFTSQVTFLVGSNVTYSCLPGYIRVPGTKNSIICLTDSTWSTPETFCKLRSCGSPGDITNGEMHLDNTLFGSRVNYTCNIGYRMISRKNYRECKADGSWSNEVPVCEVQICTPPNPIVDGSYDPEKEEYTYQDVVTYQCRDKKFALVGESSLFCTTYGNWSSDAPKCVAVECSSPDVANAVKTAGFIGPYYFKYAVTFECSSGFTMKGANSVKCNTTSQWDPPLPTCNTIECPSPDVANAIQLSGLTGPYSINVSVTFMCHPDFTMKGSNLVRCNVRSQWDPPLPTCNKNNVAAVMGNCIIILTMILLGHVLSHHA